ncbi:M56 family metallopeptidase [Archangium sp.]|uniref:M56 family metallopeptidase n=1 Tax=Archangium sp. TaxID=1872627 RepID=UPI002D5AE893|nr:M56 family metallopeptidase [Archangium sp.]HYO57490.1 M56 family metallopeptidase [Archangium sp.]
MSALDVHAVMEHGLGVLRTLWQVTWQGALWALAVWALTRLLPRLPASVRTTLWWLVGLKCLVGLCAPGAVRLPLLPAPEAPVAVVEKVAPVAVKIGGEPTPVVHALEPTGTRTGWTPLMLGALLLWLGGILWQGRELRRGLVQLRRIRREARPLEDATLHQAAATLGRELGLARIPRLLVSEHAPSPLALGLLRPEVILPRRALETLSPLEQRMALAHELAHVRRGDLWLGWVPALARAVFFFHPLVRRACREYALAREESCDAAALQATGAAPREYGRLLLIFGVARAPAAAAVPGASSHLAALKRRIAMLEHAGTESKHRHRQARWLLGVLALVALIPFQVVARETPAATTPSKPAPATPATAPATAPRVALAAPAVQPKPPAPPAAPPSAPEDEDEEDEEDDAFAYVLVRAHNSTMMSGSMRDLRRARSLAGDGNQPFLYLRRDEQEYLIRDAATLKAIEDAFEPQGDLGKKQEEIGKLQAEIGLKQAEIGEKQAELGLKQAEVGEKMGALGRKQAELALAQIRQEKKDGKESPEFERQEEQLEREQESLDEQMEALSRQMEEYGRQMETLSQPMEEYGRQMEKYGRQMEAHGRRAEKKVRALLDNAVRKGLAEPVKR